MCSEGRRHDGDDIHIVSAEKCNTMEVTGFCLTAAVSDVFCIKVSVGFILREHESLCNTADNSCTVVKIFLFLSTRDLCSCQFSVTVILLFHIH